MSSYGNDIAPDGQVYVCGACGKRSRDLYGSDAIDPSWDESCTLHAVLCAESSLVFGEGRFCEQGRVAMSNAKPRRQRCPGSGKTVRLQGLQIAFRFAPCPECQALRSIAPQPDRTAVLPTHMREVK